MKLGTRIMKMYSGQMHTIQACVCIIAYVYIIVFSAYTASIINQRCGLPLYMDTMLCSIIVDVAIIINDKSCHNNTIYSNWHLQTEWKLEMPIHCLVEYYAAQNLELHKIRGVNKNILYSM